MQSIHILLVEDNEGDILLITEALHENGSNNTIAVTRDGWEAIQYLEKKAGFQSAKIPDLILLDINMPKMNGHEVLQHIKSSDKLKHIPVIMLTTSSMEQDIFQSYQHQASCYITKPVEVNHFLHAVSTIREFWTTIVQLPNKIHR